MKRFLSILAVLTWSVSSLAQSPSPTPNPNPGETSLQTLKRLISGVGGGTFVDPNPGEGELSTLKRILYGVVTSPVAPYMYTVAQRGITNETWIAARTDGVAGTGTAEDPYDGSSISKLAALISATTTGCRIHLGPGTFQVQNGTIVLKDYQEIVGAGMGITFLSMQNVTPGTNAATNFGTVISSTALTNMNHLAVTDLTIKGNAAAINCSGGNVMSVFGIGLTGNTITVQNVDVEDTGGPRGEAFPISLSILGSNNPCKFLCKNCVVGSTRYDSNGSTAIIYAREDTITGATPINCDNSSFGEIIDCRVNNGGEYGCAGFANMLVSHCYADNTGTNQWTCWNSDTANCQNVTIRDCTFFSSGYLYQTYGAVNIGGSATFTKFRVLNNHIYFGVNGYFMAGVHLQGNVVNAEVSNNVFDVLPGVTLPASTLRTLYSNNSGNSGVIYNNNTSDIDFAASDNAVSILAQAQGNFHQNGTIASYITKQTAQASATSTDGNQANAKQIVVNAQPDGSLLINYTLSSAGLAYIGISSGTGYTVQTGDALEYDIYGDAANPNFYAFVDGGAFGAGNYYLRDLQYPDQNGVITRADLSGYATGRWYHRVISLSGMAGNVTHSGFSLFSTESAPTGAYKVYLRRIVITRAGSVVYTIYDGSTAATGANLGNSNVSSYAVTDGYQRKVSAGLPVNLPSYTVLTLPTGRAGDVAYVTDATSPTYNGTLTGGGTVKVLALYNGTAWVAH